MRKARDRAKWDRAKNVSMRKATRRNLKASTKYGDSETRREGSHKGAGGLTWVPLISVSLAAFAVEIPFFFRGTPSGHDVEFHLYSWLEVLSQWKQGIIYPRWAALAHFGYGEPRFIFYPPASWTLGAVIAKVFPWTLAADIYVWIALVAAGASMFLLARRFFDRRDATFAAVLYAINPYHLVIVYWRSAFAELLASSLVPLLLLVLLRTDLKPRRAVACLSLILAGGWLINAPAAVMLHYSLALMVGILAWQRREPRLLLIGTAAVLLGALVAGFYLLPAVYEQRWINIAQSVSVGSRPLDNFLFVHTSDAEHDTFNRVISWIAVAEMLVTIVAAWAAYRWRRRNRELWWPLVVWGAACAVVMFPVSNLIWDLLPKLRFMQFPWRWSLCLGLPFTLLIVMGIRRWPARIAIYLATLLVLGFAWQHYQPPWWDNNADLREMQDNMSSGAGYEGTDEYTPIGADAFSIDKDARLATVDGAARAAIRILEWKAEHKVFTIDISAPDNVALHLFQYPAWRVRVNGREVQASAREGTGQMLIPVETGTNRVEITFVRTWDRMAGAWISGLGLIVIVILLRRPARSEPKSA